MNITLTINKLQIIAAIQQLSGMIAKRTGNFDLDAITDDEETYVDTIINESINTLTASLFRYNPIRRDYTISLTIRGNFDTSLETYASTLATNCIQDDVIGTLMVNTLADYSSFYSTRSANNLQNLLLTLTKRKKQ